MLALSSTVTLIYWITIQQTGQITCLINSSPRQFSRDTFVIFECFHMKLSPKKRIYLLSEI